MRYDIFLKIKDNARIYENLRDSIIDQLLTITMDMFKIFEEKLVVKKLVFKGGCQFDDKLYQ